MKKKTKNKKQILILKYDKILEEFETFLYFDGLL